MFQKVVLLVLVMLMLCSCGTIPESQRPELDQKDPVVGLINQIYDATGKTINWRMMSGALQYTTHEEIQKNPQNPFMVFQIAPGDQALIITSLRNGKEVEWPVRNNALVVIPFLVENSAGVAWSGFILIYYADGHFWVDDSLSVMSDSEIESIYLLLERLLNTIQA